jgi:hypothetical protein
MGCDVLRNPVNGSFHSNPTNNPAEKNRRDYLLLVAFLVFVPYFPQQLLFVLVYIKAAVEEYSERHYKNECRGTVYDNFVHRQQQNNEADNLCCD